MEYKGKLKNIIPLACCLIFMALSGKNSTAYSLSWQLLGNLEKDFWFIECDRVLNASMMNVILCIYESNWISFRL